jgi:hypothetical protein
MEAGAIPAIMPLMALKAQVDLDKVTTAVIHDGDEEEVYICLDSETAWKKVANQMIRWLPKMIAEWGPEAEDLASFKEMVEKHEYSEAAELWNEMTNGEQHFEVDASALIVTQESPVWPAEIEI